MAFYGAIEQMLTGWIFGLLPAGEEHFERAKWLVVETVCGGLETASRRARPTAGNRLPSTMVDENRLSMMENEMVKRLMWSGLLAALGALSSVIGSAPPRGSGGACSTRSRPSERRPGRQRPGRRTSPPRSPRSPSAPRCWSARRSSSPRPRSPRRRPSSRKGAVVGGRGRHLRRDGAVLRADRLRLAALLRAADRQRLHLLLGLLRDGR